MVEKSVKMLEAAGQLENTYIIYTTDNGYHISQHSMHPGKECGFETDVHIPLIIVRSLQITTRDPQVSTL